MKWYKNKRVTIYLILSCKKCTVWCNFSSLNQKSRCGIINSIAGKLTYLSKIGRYSYCGDKSIKKLATVESSQYATRKISW